MSVPGTLRTSIHPRRASALREETDAGKAGDISSGDASESRREAYLFAPCAGLLLHHRNVGGVLVLHADHVIAGIDVENLSGHTAPEV